MSEHMKTSQLERIKLRRVLIVCLVALALLIAGLGCYIFIQSRRTTFLRRTVINGTAMAGKTPQEAADLLADGCEKVRVEVTEGGQVVLSGSLSDFGYALEQETLLSRLEKLQEAQNDTFSHLLSSIFVGDHAILPLPMTLDEEKLSGFANAASLSVPRVETQDALLLMAEDYSYYIQPEVYGNNFSDAAFQTYVKEALERFLTEEDLTQTDRCEIPISEELYAKPQIFSGDQAMVATCNAYNQFSRTQVVYQFGSQTEVLNWGTVVQWVGVDTESQTGYLMEEPIRAYVSDLAARYNTRYYQRTFHTSYGTDITIPGSLNEYGYTVDEEAEYNRLLQDLYANAPVAREPVYVSTNSYDNPVYYHREGRDDLAGTYVEVSIDSQYLWFYKDGQVIVESPIVTGSVAKGTQTQTGCFPLAYKESPSVLTGSNAENGYSQPVNFWMPFYEGQGLHDATWRSSFGGQIYLSNGSHGCVNLPYDRAEAIYNNIEAGTAIIIY